MEKGLEASRNAGRTWLCSLTLAAGAALAAAEGGAEVSSQEVTIGPDYAASAVHRWLFGSDYRRLWTAPVRLERLDLGSFAGGLTPAFRVGGQQTKGLAFKGKDGRDYTFRSVDKDPTEILPEELRDTFAREIVQDQMAAQHPASPPIVEELMAAAGIPHTKQTLVVMPDDPALGEYRKEFAGVVGTLYEFPQPLAAANPGFMEASEILKHKDFYARIAADPKDRPDARALLKARLLDILIGDWDRHRDQWRWAKIPGRELWQPIPDDRDQAFSRYEGLVLGLVRDRQPRFQKYGPAYPAMTGLTWNGWEQDRFLLTGLESSAWAELAAELKSQITDDVIERAARRMPAELFALDGERLIRSLRGRRDALPEAARAFYRHLAREVDVYLTNQAELVEAEHRADGGLALQAWAAERAAEPFFRRTFLKDETREVRLYLEGGNDRVVVSGRPAGIRLRVIGGGGSDVVDDSKAGGTRVHDSAGVKLETGRGTHLDGRPYARPPGPENAPWIPPREWGGETYRIPYAGYGADLGAFLGAGIDIQRFGFRKHPYASRHIVRAGWSFGASTYRAEYQGERRFENRSLHANLHAYASGIESLRFYGFGNETEDAGDDDSFKVKNQQYSLTPGLALPLARNVTFTVGPTLKYTRSRDKDEPLLINSLQPYGYGDFGAVGLTGLLALDSRVAARRKPGGVSLLGVNYPRQGFLVSARGTLYPKAWDVDETFGLLEGSAAAYATFGGERAPTLALRAGGKKLFGSFPYFEAAYLGGGFRSDALVRGLQKHRYAGDAVLFGNADLRFYVSRFRFLVPGEWGVFGFGDLGRVYLDGESSDDWHYGGGGGLWFAFLDRANTVSVSVARSEGRNAVYVRAGFGF